MEANLDGLPIELIAGVVQQVCLDGAGFALNDGSHADADRGGELARARVGNASVDTILRHDLRARSRNVEGGESDGAAELLAFDHHSSHGIGPSMDFSRVGDAALGNGASNRRAAHSLSLVGDWLKDFGGQMLGEPVRRAFPPFAESKIVADHELFRSKFIDENVVQKVGRGHLGEMMIEGKDDADARTRLAHPPDVLFQGGDGGRTLFWSQGCCGVAIEGHHDAWNPLFCGNRDRSLNEGAMASMDAIKSANAHHSFLPFRVQEVYAKVNQHRVVLQNTGAQADAVPSASKTRIGATLCLTNFIRQERNVQRYHVPW